MHSDDDEPLRLPDPREPPPRAAFPLLTALMPALGAVVLWQLTGSVYALWFAALGPLLAVAGLLDGVRGRRRERRRERRRRKAAWTRLEGEIADRQDRERAELWRRYPGVRGYLADGDQIWRSAGAAQELLVIGSGTRASRVRLAGGADGERERALRRRAGTLTEAPVTVPMRAGIAVVGPEILVAGVVRALLLQLCLAHPPGRLRVADGGPESLPHREATAGTTVRVGNGSVAQTADAEVTLRALPTGAALPPRCAAVLTVTGPEDAVLTVEGAAHRVRVEAVSTAQAEQIAQQLAQRAAETLGLHGGVKRLAMSELLTPPAAAAPSLRAPIGICGGEPLSIDLVEDGPHAVVIGVTGSGKSELLISWVTAMCHGRTAAEVGFLLIDFKGGSAFDLLRELPHVTGVVTDLDEATALRAVTSLRAEIRHREQVLSDRGARDIAAAPGVLPRLVIVVDEYAALAAAHHQVHELFADIAARGRALGMHLILASQRATGTFRDALLSNAPLRIALRVTDAADSRAVLGTEEAALLSGRPDARGVALVRRSADAAAAAVRVARCEAETVARVAAQAGTVRARPAWRAALADRIPLREHSRAGRVVLGRADEPERQAQPLLCLPAPATGFAVVGGPRSGKSTLLRSVAQQRDEVVWIPGEPEGAWDALVGIESGTTVVVDDADALAARFPPEYAAAWLERLERIAREAGECGTTLVFSAARLGGPLARTADLLSHRAVLRLGSRAEHVAAGGESADYVAEAPPGRGRWGRTLVQFCDTPALPRPTRAGPRRWAPGRRPAGYVVSAAGAGRDLLQRAAADGMAVVPVTEAESSTRRGTLLWGAPEAWLARWSLLSALRAEGELIVDAGCAAEYRALTGRRELPPYAAAGRAWRLTPDGAVERVC